MFKYVFTLGVALLFLGTSSFAALPVIPADHFEGGQNLNKGQRRGNDAILAELMKDVQSEVADAQANKYDASNVVEATFTATFDQAVGAKVVVVRKVGKQVTLEIPTGSTADGGGAAIASGATDVPAAYRPAANLSFPVVATDNSALVFGKLIVSSTGQLSFTASAAGASFTNGQPAGFDRVAVTYTLP